MPEILFLLVGLLVVAGVVVGYVATTRRSRGPELEPPPEQRAGTTTLERPPEAPPEEGPAVEVPPAEVPPVEEAPPAVEAPAAPPRLRDRLGKARATLAGYVGSVLGRSGIDAETWDELEEALLLADVGVGPTMEILDHVRARVKDEGITDPEALVEVLKAELKDRIGGGDRTLRRDVSDGRTCVWLFVGVNGVGKTTTIGKVAARERAEGRQVLLAAGDTFRAAAAEQLEMWAERAGADFVRGAEGSDPSSVIFDGVQRAASRGHELVLADTAGRLHTKVNLMEELAKVRRVSDREPGQVAEVLLVIDATTGQNGLTQARQFAEAADVTGVVLTKLDGSAKGGIVVAIQTELGIPVKLVGLGETAADLVEFDPDEFVEALFASASTPAAHRETP
ncbi:signal recognition particle-docking protein FtsY [Actinomarinicola tropica]|uniref:Signal recognition particle receptor FtsY n=1 Tax=Actinomarinicola tropica TaxID=2789776 RepID=A0A5Q2RKB8_9ACTN|nr:signal recognition particle-docking protein FtsY [Actinomarinicola tropica]QGG94846.1 signal recognition particle-docking protein FtsY [Actinomarinicola tropica]